MNWTGDTRLGHIPTLAEGHASRRSYPYEDGDVIVLGPEIFAARDGGVICWKGENYVRQSPIRRDLSACGAKGDEMSGIGIRAYGVFLRLVFLAEGPLWTAAAVGVALGWAHFPHGFWAGVSAVALVLLVPVAWLMTYLAITDWEIAASAESSHGTGRP